MKAAKLYAEGNKRAGDKGRYYITVPGGALLASSRCYTTAVQELKKKKTVGPSGGHGTENGLKVWLRSREHILGPSVSDLRPVIAALFGVQVSSHCTTGLLLNPKFEHLSKESFWEVRDLYQWEGFWYYEDLIKGVLAFQSDYEARGDDVILASSMKTGTTWLKALCVSIMGSHSKSYENGEDDLLVENVPHAHIRTLEFDVYRDNPHPDLSGMPSPRLFHTHLTYSALPDSIKNSDCKIVYITRNPKDTLVSMWHFYNKIIPTREPYPFEKAYHAFCKGIHPYGPYFDHVLQYWLESLKMPEKILFLKYEQLQRDPKEQVKRLASFLGRPFGNEDDVDKVLMRSSLDRLKNLEVNKNGTYFHTNIPNSVFFRLGVVGDWENYFTEEMEQGLDEITSIKLGSFGLDFYKN